MTDSIVANVKVATEKTDPANRLIIDLAKLTLVSKSRKIIKRQTNRVSSRMTAMASTNAKRTLPLKVIHMRFFKS